MRKTLARGLALAALVALAGCGGTGGTKEFHVTASGDGFVPKKITVRQGQPTVLIVKRTTDATCATEAIFVETGLKYDLPLGEEVRIHIPTERVGTFHYACGMDMYHGEVEVKP